MIVNSFAITQPKFKNKYFYKPDECGEDSYFIYKIRNRTLAIGVADGVGSWKHSGIDPALFSRALTSNAFDITNNHYYNNLQIDSYNIMNLAYEQLKKDERNIYGSATFCSVNFIYEEDKIMAKSINLGDSGYIIIRNFKLVYQSQPQRKITYRRSCPHQIANVPPHLRDDYSGNSINDSVIAEHTLEEDDIIILATDGFWDFVNITNLLNLVKENKHLSIFNLSTLLLQTFIRKSALYDTTLIIAQVNKENIEYI